MSRCTLYNIMWKKNVCVGGFLWLAIYVEVKYKDKLYFNLNKISVMQAQSE
jgi:hypothetical protein